MPNKIILVGYPESQCIVKASKYLTGKYLPGFDVTYLNYTGHIEGWAKYVAGFLKYLTDETVIFALDDYLISGHIDEAAYEHAAFAIGDEIVCVKLCQSTQEEHWEYPCTTQYCIWNREYLIWLLEQVTTPWEFEVMGSRFFSKKSVLRTCIPYFTNSALSKRWEGIRLDGLSEHDINFIKSHGLI